MAEQIITNFKPEFTLFTTGQASTTITSTITRNTFVSVANVDVSEISIERLYILAYAADNATAPSSRIAYTIPDYSLSVTVDGSSGLAAGTVISCASEWRIYNGVLSLGFCPPKWAGGGNTQTPQAPFDQLYLLWYLFYA